MHINAEVLHKKLLLDLESHIDTSLNTWSVDSTPREAACYALKASLLKKFNNLDEPPPHACSVALEKFKTVNGNCAKWVIQPEFSWEEEVLNLVRDVVSDFWFDQNDPLISDLRQCYVAGRAGPGSSLGTKSKDFYSKYFDSDLTGTPDLVPTWDQCVVDTDLPFEAELRRSVQHGVKAVTASKYSFVNKTQTVARGICTEPSMNMWMQLGAGNILHRRLRTFFGIDLSIQPDFNRELARHGSIFESFATIDLESASDSISTGMLRWLLPRSFFGVLKSLRCPSTELPSGEVLELNMVSTMGNGFTFPLQTMIFSAVVFAVYRYVGVPLVRSTKKRLGNYGVFGDDIIVDESVARYVIRVLNLLGFVVNREKSFVEGPFRESCGADYFLGSNVRGVYIKRLKTLQDLFVAINLLNRWSSKSQVFLPETVSYLMAFIRHPARFLVPPDEDDAAGIHIPRRMVPPSFNNKSRRFHTGVHHYRAHVPIPKVLAFTFCGAILIGSGPLPKMWRELERSDLQNIDIKGYKLHRTETNYFGFAAAVYYGSIRAGLCALRQKVPKYQTKHKFTPNWSDLVARPLEDPIGSSSNWRFVNACESNLCLLDSEA